MKASNLNKVRFLLFVVMAICLVTASILVLPQSVAQADATALTFNADNWTAESGTLPDGNTLSVTNEGKTLLHTKQTYTNFHLTYKVQYSADSTNKNPWYGESGVLLRSSGSGLDGFWLGFYGYNNNLFCSIGNYVNNVYHAMTGSDAGWGGAGYNENTIDVYVFGGWCNIIINGWLFQNAPLPYDASGHVSIISEGVTGTFKDFAIEPLADDFDFSAGITRANWSGNNQASEQWYWNGAGKDQMFRMKLPDDLTGITKYYLARTSKIADNGQSVDVLIDTTGTKTFDDTTWGEKAFTWGDYTGAKADYFAVNTVSFEPSILGDVEGGATIGFYLDKNADGWYSANNYWLLYEKEGKVYVADYFDLVYSFDRDAHAYAWDTPDNYLRGFWFINQADLSLVSSIRGEDARFVQNPAMSKVKDVSYTFAVDEGAKTLDMGEYINIDKKGIGYKLSYAVDGVATDVVTLAPATKTGTITVTLSPDGKSADNSGAIYFNNIVVDVPYSTVLTIPEGSLAKIGDVNVNVTDDTTTVDLLDYVETDIEGEWSYTYGGQSYQGTILDVAHQTSLQDAVLTVVPSNGGEEKSVTIAVNVTAYTYPQAVQLPYFMDSQATGWTVLNGIPYQQDGKWVADDTHSWDVMADLGATSYTLQAQMLAGAGADVDKYGILLQAEIGANGMSGLLVGFEAKSDNGLYVNIGWLNDGVYTQQLSVHSGFGRGTEYLTTFVVDGSSVQLIVNGWRILHFQNKYTAGSRIAILNEGNTMSYSDLQVYRFNDYAGDYVVRTQWNGIDTYSKMATITGATSVTFALPQDGSNYRLVSRTDLWKGAQSASISINGADKGEWQIAQGEHNGDVSYTLGELTGESVTVGITPTSASFRSSYLWLVYEKDGKDYVADCLYFGHAGDISAHNVSGTYTLSGVEKHFISTSNVMLLTFAQGEEVIVARNKGVLDLMQAKTYSDSSISASVTLPYRLYLPTNYDESKQYPVLLFLHGAGERGSDNIIHVSAGSAMGTEYLIKKIILGEYADDFIVVAPQCPTDMRWVEQDWVGGGYNLATTEQSVPSKLVQSLMYNEIFANYSVDRSRVYGAGLSMGGFGVTDLAMRNPDMFAAIVNCAGGADASQAQLLATTALRAWHSEGDTTVNNDALLALVNNMQTAGLEARYTEVVNNGHMSWLVAFEDPDLIPWLLSHQKTWTIQVETNGGDFDQTLPQTYDKTLQEIILQAPTKEGYKFDGWYLDEAFTQQITSISGQTAHNVSLHAKWVQSVSVVLKDGDATLQTINGYTGDVVDLAEYKPTKEGYLFLGWNDGSSDISATAKITLSANTTLTAKWIVVEYSVKIFDGDNTVYSQNVAHGGSVSFTPANKTGYTFTGYYTDAELTTKATLPETITANITLYLGYEKVSYTVTIVVTEGNSTTKTVLHGDTFTVETPTRQGYEFKGWFTDSAFTTPYQVGAITQNLTIYAKWEVEQTTPTEPIEPDDESGANVGLIVALSVVGVAAIATPVTIVLIKKKKRG